MRENNEKIDEMPVIKDPREFDPQSGNWLERLVFNHRIVWIVVFSLITIVLGYQATKIKLEARFEKMIPHNDPYIQNYLKYKDELPGLGNAIRIVVQNTKGSILNAEYLEVLRRVSDEVFLIPGVDRAWMKSLWTPSVRWNAVTEKGFEGGPVMPPDYNGSEASLAQLLTNIGNAGLIGSLVATDQSSSMIIVPLLEKNPKSGESIDYTVFCRELEKIRSEVEQSGDYKVHIIGFAKLVSDLIDGLLQVTVFFCIAIIIATLIICLYTRCIRSTAVVILCSLVAVIWQLGLLVTFGFAIDPYSILVPFLVFAIGVSHGVQKMNGVMRDIALGTHRIVAARYTFRRLFLAGLTALITDTVGFSVMMIIDIPVIRDLALLASIGVGVIIFTNLLLIPLVLSFVGVSPAAAARAYRARNDKNAMVAKISDRLSQLTERKEALIVAIIAIVLGAVGLIGSRGLQVGDLDPGAPELRPDSRYNMDNAYITENYALSSDVFAIIVKTPPMGGMQYETLIEIDRLAWELQQLPEVQSTYSVSGAIKKTTSGTADGSPKWYALSRDQKALNFAMTYTLQLNPELSNLEVSVIPIIAYLTDHKAATLENVVKAVEAFAEKHNTKDHQFLLAAGNAGVEAATNIVVEKANTTMMVYVYSAIILLCFVTFRTWRAVIVAVLPLIITSFLCETLMVLLGVGVKVATLPVIALGVGIGVDYALYLVSIQLQYQRSGMPLKEAYRRALRFTGKVVALVGVTFSAGVITWIYSPIKFQADMGILLTFMFFWNMLGALLITPAISHFVMQTRWILKKTPSEKKSSEKEKDRKTSSALLSEPN